MTGTLRDGLARAIDHDAFEDHPIEARSLFASLQWSARRKYALDAADAALAYLAQQDNSKPAPSFSQTWRNGPDVEAIAGVLREHMATGGMSVASGVTCRCGYWTGNEEPGKTRPVGYSGLQWHQAEQIAALPPQTHRMPPRSDRDGSVGTDDRAGRNGEPE